MSWVSALIVNHSIDADSYIIVLDDSKRFTVVDGTGITDNYTKMFTHFSTSSMYTTEPPADASTATFFKVNNNYAPTPAVSFDVSTPVVAVSNVTNIEMCCMKPA